MKNIVWVLILNAVLLNPIYMDRPAFAKDPAVKRDVGHSASFALEKAQQLARKGDYAGAISLLEPFAESSRENTALYSDYIVFQFWAGNVRSAIALFESMPDTIPQRPYLIRNIAKAYYDIEEYEKSARQYARAVEKDPADMIAKTGWIRCLLKLKRYDEAEQQLWKWLELSPNETILALLRAEVRFHTGHYAEALHQLHLLAASPQVDPDQIDQTRETLITGVATGQQDLLLVDLRQAADAGVENIAADYVLALILLRQYGRALVYLEASDAIVDPLPDPYLYWTAWAYFKEKRLATAEAFFKELMERNNAYVRAPIGLAHVYAVQGRTDLALTLLSDLRNRLGEDTLEMRFALAYVYEQAGRFSEASTIYDAMQSDYPANKTVAKLRLNALSDMGAISEALTQSEETLPDEAMLHRSIQARKAVSYIQWNEPEMAVKFLIAELAKDPRSTLRFEYISALVAAKRYAEVIPVYEELETECVRIPAWAMEKAAGAYLVEKQPEKALALYEQAISLNPALRDARMGRFYALQALREWRAAEKQLLDLETVTKPIIGSGRHKRFNPDLLDLYIERGWLLASEARLKEADAYFAELRDIAPANLDIRNAQAHVASWRGWKRKSLNSFRILESMEPDYLSARPGKIAVLDALSQKGTARRELSQMLTLHPRDKRFHNLNRIFQLGDMNVLSMEIRAQWEDDDTNDIFLQTTVSTPLSLDKNKLNYTQLHAFTLWRRTWNDDFKDAAGEDEAYFRRAGIGADHVFNSTFAFRQQFSYDYYEGGDFGSYTRLRITPDDHWRVDALVDTFTIDVPARARIQDITAVKTSLGTVYRESEWRDYSLSLGRQWFSDDNNRDELLAGISQNLWVKDDWKMRLSGHAYFSMNSEYDDPTIIYFNPKNAWGLSVTHMTEQIVYHHYDRWFIHRLFLSAGNYKQYSYDNSFVGSIRYEQEYAFTDTHHLTWAGVFARNVYDGDTVSSVAFEFTYQWRF